MTRVIRHAPTRSSLRHSRLLSRARVSSLTSGSLQADRRWVWLGLGQLVLAAVTSLATVTLMAATNFRSQFSWTFYSGPWVLVTLSLYILIFGIIFVVKRTKLKLILLSAFKGLQLTTKLKI